MTDKILIVNLRKHPGVISNWLFVENLINRARVVKANTKIILCSPLSYLYHIQILLNNSHPTIWCGVCDVSGADIYNSSTIKSLLEFNCRYQLIGSSSSRVYNLETEEMLAEKTRLSSLAGIVPIVCIGETYAERRAGMTTTILHRQLSILRSHLAISNNSILAYCPVVPNCYNNIHHLKNSLQAITTSINNFNLSVVYGGIISPCHWELILSLGYHGLLLNDSPTDYSLSYLR